MVLVTFLFSINSFAFIHLIDQTLLYTTLLELSQNKNNFRQVFLDKKTCRSIGT